MNQPELQNYREIADMPLYGVSEAARYIGVNYATLYSWLKPVRFETDDGYSKKPIITVVGHGLTRLSFLNLVEAFVVKALRTTHGVPLTDIRTAVEYAERKEGIERLLVHEQLKAGAQGVFIDRLGELINMGRAGQYAMKKILADRLERIEFHEGLAFKLFPLVSGVQDKGVVISPLIAFGKPVVSGQAISTRVIASRFDLGDTEQELADDYGIKVGEVEEAILYECAA